MTPAHQESNYIVAGVVSSNWAFMLLLGAMKINFWLSGKHLIFLPLCFIAKTTPCLWVGNFAPFCFQLLIWQIKTEHCVGQTAAAILSSFTTVESTSTHDTCPPGMQIKHCSCWIMCINCVKCINQSEPSTWIMQKTPANENFPHWPGNYILPIRECHCTWCHRNSEQSVSLWVSTSSR